MIEDGHLVGDEPIGDALLVEEQLHDVELGLGGGEHLFVVATEIFSQARGKQIEIVLADDFRFGGEAKAFIEFAVGADELERGVLGKEGEPWQVVHQGVELALRGHQAKKLGAKIVSGRHESQGCPSVYNRQGILQ